MPYRRLPKTDKARIEALKRAVETYTSESEEQPISFALIQKAQTIMPQFINNVAQYNFFYDKRVAGNKEMKKIASQARMYVSHFMQVLFMAFERGDNIKRSQLSLYGFDKIPEVMPHLVNYDELCQVGKQLIEGERKRTMQGGIPINCPTIQVVNVFYEKFCETLFSQRTTVQSTERYQQNVKDMREQVDELLLNIWDEVEAFYDNLTPYQKFMACQACGVIYYYQKGEKPLTPESEAKPRKVIKEVAPADEKPAEEEKPSEEEEIIIDLDDAMDQTLF